MAAPGYLTASSRNEFAARRGLFAIGTLSGIPPGRLFADISSKDEWTVLPFPSNGKRAGYPVYALPFKSLI